MIPALILGRKGSTAFPRKNVYPVMGRKLSYYTMVNALHSRWVDKVFISTDDSELMELGEELGLEVIKRPDYLCTKEALGEDAYIHGYQEIKKRYPNELIESIVLLFCNAPTFTPKLIDDGIEALRADLALDSAVTVSQMNWYSPVRARKLNKQNLLEPYIPFENYPKEMDMTINCDRNKQINCYFADVSVSVVRPANLEHIDQGVLPQKWMGSKIYPLFNVGGLDIDEMWQLPLVEGYLRNLGFSEAKIPWK